MTIADRALPATPDRAIDSEGAPRFGTYLGPLDAVGIAHLGGEWRRGALYRLKHHKSWRWCMLANAEVMVAFALVDVGYATNAFLFAVDLAARRMLVDRTALGLPRLSVKVGDRPNEGSTARFAAQGLRLTVSRTIGRSAFRVTADARDISIDAELDTVGAPPSLVLIAPVPGGTVNVTEKTGCLEARGTARILGRSHELSGGSGGFDYTNGLLARHTAWRWAFASGRAVDGRRIGLNLVEGFNEAGTSSENVVWSDSTALLVGRAHFRFSPGSPLDAWTVTTDDGAVDLAFTPIGAHREDRDLVLARSHFVQVVGTFDGTLRTPTGPVRVSALAGVTEDQDVLW